MRLWTNQPVAVLREVERQGFAYAFEKQDPAIPHAYRWLRRNLKAVLPGYTGRSLWWFYCERPDLRRFRHRFARGTRHVRIEMEVSPERVFAFACWAWDIVFSGQYLALSLEEYRGWKRDLVKAVPDEHGRPPPAPLQQQLEASWLRLFTGVPRRPWKGHSRAFPLAPRGCEAVVETIYLSDIRRVTHFVGSSTWKPRRKGALDGGSRGG